MDRFRKVLFIMREAGWFPRSCKDAGVAGGRFRPILLFSMLMGIYWVNGIFLPGDDVTGNLFFPIQLLTKGKVTISAEDHPFMFVWQEQGMDNGEQFQTVGWRKNSREWPGSRGYSIEDWRYVDSRYFLSPSEFSGEYVNTFGMGAGLYALPYFFVMSLFWDLETVGVHSIFYLGKVAASAAVAGSAVVLFCIARRFLASRQSLLLFWLYGIGTCTWSVASQTLWQHAPNLLFISLTFYFLLKERCGIRDYFFIGLFSALATMCRPTSFILVVCVLVYGIWKNRSRAIAIVGGGFLPGIVLGLYNAIFLGAPWRSAQIEKSRELALIKTGSDEVWHWFSMEGFLGLLLSPSRGLLVYSPHLIFALVGIAVYFRRRAAYPWLGVPVAFLLIQYGVASSWYDWWGGWSYGYRPLIDSLPALTLCLIPVMKNELLWSRWQGLFIYLGFYSILIQGLGAFAYHLGPGCWNAGMGKNIDSPEFRHRLWDVGDNQIFYYLLNLPNAVQQKYDSLNY